MGALAYDLGNGETQAVQLEHPLPVTVVASQSGGDVIVNESAQETTAGAGVTATMPAVSGQTNYLSGFTVTAGRTPTGGNVTVTVTGLTGGTLTYTMVEPVDGQGYLHVPFPTPVAASAANTAISVAASALSGGGEVAIQMYGSLT